MFEMHRNDTATETLVKNQFKRNEEGGEFAVFSRG